MRDVEKVLWKKSKVCNGTQPALGYIEKVASCRRQHVGEIGITLLKDGDWRYSSVHNYIIR